MHRLRLLWSILFPPPLPQCWFPVGASVPFHWKDDNLPTFQEGSVPPSLQCTWILGKKQNRFEAFSWDSHPGLLTPKSGLIVFSHATSFSHSLNPNDWLVFKDSEKVFVYLSIFKANCTGSCTCSCSVSVCWNEISTTAFLWEHCLWNCNYNHFLLFHCYPNTFFSKTIHAISGKIETSASHAPYARATREISQKARQMAFKMPLIL